MRGQTVPCGFCVSALFFTLCCSLSLVENSQAETTSDSGIIFEERTITRGQAQRLSSILLRKSASQSAPQPPVPAQSRLAPENVKVPVRVSSLPLSSHTQASIQDISEARIIQDRPKATENLLDSIDVYALSPHAAQLFLPRMIPQSAVQKWYATHRQSQLRLGIPSADWDAIIQHASVVSGLDAALIAAVIRVESDFDAYAVSSKGAQGAMQIMPSTQAELGLEDAFNPHSSVEAGSRYLRKQLDRFGSIELALAAYNAGAGNVERYGGIPPFKETQDYVRKVMALLGE